MEKCVKVNKKTPKKCEKSPKIGDYVRTKYGHIGKIMSKSTQMDIKMLDGEIKDFPVSGYLLDTFYNFDDENDFITKNNIKSSGKRLIDVVERGDLVNMLLVFQITSIIGVPSSKRVKLIDGNKFISLKDKDIRHVVCHEVLERDGYENK